MQFRNSAQRYGMVSQSLHWLTVILVAVAWTLGTFGDEIPKGAARATGLFIHISAGLAILVLLAIRLVWRFADPVPLPEPNKFSRWLGAFTDTAGRLTHYVLYGLLVAVPTTGVIYQFAHGDTLPLFGFFAIPSPWAADRAFAHNVKEVHEIAANALVILALFHAVAALIHHMVFRDNTLVRMLPRRGQIE
jgi:cytochrome b561